MKKLIALLLALIMVLSLCACDAKEESIRKPTGKSVGKLIEDPTDETTTEPQTTEETTEDPDDSSYHISIPDDPNNVYIDLDNHAVTDGEVMVRARQAWWEDGNLRVECFIINGLDHHVNTVIMGDFIISNRDGVLADGYFGQIQEVDIAPGEYITHTYSFKGEAVKMPQGDLSYLHLSFSLQYNN